MYHANDVVPVAQMKKSKSFDLDFLVEHIGLMNPQFAQNWAGEVKFGDSANHIQIAEQFVGVHHHIINL